MLNKAFYFVLTIAGMSACANTNRVEPRHSLVSSVRSEIVSVVAADFARTPDCDYGTGKSGIVVDSNVASSQGLVSDEWLAHNLKPEMWAQVSSLTQPLRAVNSTAQLVDWGLLDTPDLAVRDLSALDERQLEELASEARCFATFLLPVLSSDGDEALVALYVGPSPHGAIAFYALKRGAAGWTVATRRFFHFL